MADWKKQDDDEYVDEELADAQQDSEYADRDSISDEQSTGPEKMQKPGHDHQGSKSQSQGWKG